MLKDNYLIPFKRYLADRCGLYFRDSDRKSLMDAISERMAACGLDSPEKYSQLLRGSQQGEDEFRELLNLLTVQHTYFFRNWPHFHVLRDKVLPEIIEKKMRCSLDNYYMKPAIRVWSAGCSTGEEPYSIAMVIRDIIEKMEDWEIDIYATDVSTRAIEAARAGIYNMRSIRHLDEESRRKYFVEIPGKEKRYAIQDTLKEMVRFNYLNLGIDEFPCGFDIIYCRNVFIYFQLETTIDIVEKLCSSLLDDGYLFVGHSESLQFLTDKFRMENWEDGIYYRRITRDGSQPEIALKSATDHEKVEKVVSELSREELKAERRLKGEVVNDTPGAMDDRLVQIMKLIHLKEYEKALTLIEESKEFVESTVELHYLMAEIHANRGEFDKAEKKLTTILRTDPFFAPAYYLLGSIFIEKEEMEQAKVSLKKALYLDSDFSMARFLLGIVHKSEGCAKPAMREFRNALRCLDACSPEEVIAYSGGFNALTMAGICWENIERLRSEK